MSICLYILSLFPLFSVVGPDTGEVPMYLDPILRTDNWILGTLLFAAFLLLALAKRLEPSIFSVTFRSFFTLGTPEVLEKFETRFNATGFILLGLTFFISLWVCSTLFIQQYELIEGKKLVFFGNEFSHRQLFSVVLLINFLLIVYNFSGLILTSWITGERSLFRIFVCQSWVNLLLFGIVFFILGLIWLLNPSLGDELFHLFIYLLLGFLAVRFVKLLIAAFIEGVSWYYIFLYLCTLEILPIILLYYYVA